MNTDAIERLALNRAVALSAELEVQLDKNARLQPMVAILALAREQAAIAIRGLVYVDPNDADTVRGFQNEVRRYDDLVAWIHKLIVDGKEADRRLDQMERDELDSIFNNPEVADERRALGGITQDI